ncbi:hypothetical protein [Bacillus sp. UMB0893]|uniref:hypothetical protein n=1 Tax=Bacillus sp. UMB0893 TaxID=2066053 RepID=UPI000C7747DE|nr:hypothetical protein [Bacillus sp. UMB0893]PLR66269.1 hypothetical protein CYJ36_19420 [Bacillus sp. UMB0893]QNG58218.1 hypothetical protein H4O14_10015 [Bacillus sp. PAMC26568]
MDSITQSYFKGLESKDKDVQYEAYNNILTSTKAEVDWAYEIWDQLIEGLTNTDNHKRSRSAQFLSNLAISDPLNRMLKDFSAIWNVTKDPKFVTARHSLQSVWRVGLAGPKQKEMVLKHLVVRFKNCLNEKNYTLIRFDIIQGLKNLYDEVNDEEIKQTAMDLIEIEGDNKYRKKYMTAWKKGI